MFTNYMFCKNKPIYITDNMNIPFILFTRYFGNKERIRRTCINSFLSAIKSFSTTITLVVSFHTTTYDKNHNAEYKCLNGKIVHYLILRTLCVVQINQWCNKENTREQKHWCNESASFNVLYVLTATFGTEWHGALSRSINNRFYQHGCFLIILFKYKDCNAWSWSVKSCVRFIGFIELMEIYAIFFENINNIISYNAINSLFSIL